MKTEQCTEQAAGELQCTCLKQYMTALLLTDVKIKRPANGSAVLF